MVLRIGAAKLRQYGVAIVDATAGVNLAKGELLPAVIAGGLLQNILICLL